MQDLGTLGGDSSYATAINDNSEVVGFAQTTEGTTHGFLWTAQEGMQDLGVPDGNYAGSYARAINNNGEISGTVDNSGAGKAFYWSAATGFIVLNHAANGQSINDFGRLTGTVFAGAITEACLWNPLTGKLRLLGFLPGESYSAGEDVNNKESVAGQAETDSGDFHPMFWSRATGMLDLGVPPTVDFGLANAINDHDEVVGDTWLSTTGGSGMGFYWSQSTGRIELITLPKRTFTSVSGINNRGMIAGQCAGDRAALRAVLWVNYSSKPRDLGTLPGGAVSAALGLNDQGQVVGWGDVP
jgi:probable HAF family extracellular repeat protein